MSSDLAAFLDAIDGRLLTYLDDQEDLSAETVAHLHRYAVALVQSLIVPEHVKEDWEDFFYLADAFVLAYGSRQLALLERHAPLLESGARSAEKLTRPDRVLLVNLIAELDEFLTARQR